MGYDKFLCHCRYCTKCALHRALRPHIAVTHTHTHDSSSPHRKHAVSTTCYSACSTVVVPTLTTFVSLCSYLAENTVLATLKLLLGPLHLLHTEDSKNGNRGNTSVTSSRQGWHLFGGRNFIILVTPRLRVTLHLLPKCQVLNFIMAVTDRNLSFYKTPDSDPALKMIF